MPVEDMLGLILGGGRGTRLWPLTKLRAKPAVPIAGKYRIVDIPLSNCLNSGIQQIAILTQFNSVSLHRHIAQTYNFDLFHRGWVQILAAEQTLTSSDWYQGTADAVRKQLFEIRVTGADDVLILAGDHLYRMDFAEMADFHWQSNADITVAVNPIPLQEAWRFSVSGVSTSLLSSLKDDLEDLELSPDEDFTKDPAGSFGIVEAKRHRERGVNLEMFLGLMKYYRDTYKDLVRESEFDEMDKACCIQILERFFDRVELGFCAEWATSTEQVIVKELQSTNRSMTGLPLRAVTRMSASPTVSRDRR